VLDPIRVVRDQYISSRTNFDTDMLHTRWTLLEMRKDVLQRGLPTPDEACAQDQTLSQDLQTPFTGAVFNSTLTSDCPDFEFADRVISLESEANIQKRK
jgi:hypothetical protein